MVIRLGASATRAARRVLSMIAVGMVAALTLSGCGLASGSGVSAEGETHTVTDRRGNDVEVPVNPQRIVTLSEPTMDGVLSLGVKPVGTVNGRGQGAIPNYLKDLAEGIPAVGSVSQVNFETIANLEPDLIITDGTGVDDEESLEVLNNIAPVYYAGYSGGDWHITFENVGKVLGLEDQVSEVEAAYDAKVADISQQLQEAGLTEQTYTIVRWQGDNASLILDDLPPGVALTDLGLKYPANQDAMERVGHSAPISKENMSEIDADVMFFGTLGGSSVDNPNAGGTADIEGAQKAYDEAIAVPGFASLNAVKNDNVVLVDGSAWTSTGGLTLLNKIVDDIAAALLS